MGDVQFNGTPEEWDALVEKNRLAREKILTELMDADAKDGIYEFSQKAINPIETCIMCGKDTQYRFNDHIDYRTGYIEGAGQLCLHCFNNDRKLPEMEIVIHVDEKTILNTPNDMELGGKVRNSYYQVKGL